MSKINLNTLDQNLQDLDRGVIQRFGEWHFGDKFRIMEKTGLMVIAAIGCDFFEREGGLPVYRKIHKTKTPLNN